MRLLDRYLLRELLVPLGFCLVGFLMFFIIFDLFGSLDDFQAHKLHGLDVAEYYAVKTPEFLVTVLPVALLLALLYTLTNLARHQELTAIRAAGIGLWRMCAPHLSVGFIASLGLFAMNELWVPDADDTAESILNRRRERTAPAVTTVDRGSVDFVNSLDGRIWHMDAFDRKTGEMINPKVGWSLPDGSRRELLARRASWTNGVWTFHEVIEHTYAPITGALTWTNTPWLAVSGFTESPASIRSGMKIADRLNRRRTRSADIPLVELLDYLRLHPRLTPQDRAWLLTKLQGRLATPWTCLVVVLIALPFSALTGRGSVFVGVASSLVICFGYFILLQVGLALGAGGYLSPWVAAWSPNLLVSAIGLWLLRRVQ